MVVVLMVKNTHFLLKSYLSGQVMWAVRDAAAYTAFFGDLFANANYTAEGTSSISQNGDDAIGTVPQ